MSARRRRPAKNHHTEKNSKKSNTQLEVASITID
jgi:hypothetical protein